MLAALRPTASQRGSFMLQNSRGWLCDSAAHLPGSLPACNAVRNGRRLFAARAPDGGSRASDGADDIAELAALFERAAAHERVNGYSNVAGRQFSNFGAFLVHALERFGTAGSGTGFSAAWAEASKDATRYATLRVPERSALVVRTCCAGEHRFRIATLRSRRCGHRRTALGCSASLTPRLCRLSRLFRLGRQHLRPSRVRGSCRRLRRRCSLLLRTRCHSARRWRLVLLLLTLLAVLRRKLRVAQRRLLLLLLRHVCWVLGHRRCFRLCKQGKHR